MKFSDKLKKQETAGINRNAGMRLLDEELDQVSGGVGLSLDVIRDAAKLVSDLKDKVGSNGNGADAGNILRSPVPGMTEADGNPLGGGLSRR